MAVPGYRPRRATELSGALLGAVLLALILPATSTTAHHIEVNVTVPPYELQQEDAYLCVAKLLPPNPHKLIGVIPRAEQKVTHHILIYGELGGVLGQSHACHLPRSYPWVLPPGAHTSPLEPLRKPGAFHQPPRQPFNTATAVRYCPYGVPTRPAWEPWAVSPSLPTWFKPSVPQRW